MQRKIMEHSFIKSESSLQCILIFLDTTLKLLWDYSVSTHKRLGLGFFIIVGKYQKNIRNQFFTGKPVYLLHDAPLPVTVLMHPHGTLDTDAERPILYLVGFSVLVQAGARN